MNRERLYWMSALSVVVATSVAISRAVPTVSRDDDFSFVRTLVDIQRQVNNNYVEEIEPDRLRQAAITGLLQELDPFTVYVPPARQEDFDRLLEGSFKGIGVQLNQLDNGAIEVVTPVDGSPAFKAGVKAGDVVLKINNESVEGERLPDAVKKLAGPLGTEIKLQIRRATGEVLDLEMTREEVVVPTARGWSRNEADQWDWFISDDPKIAYLRLTQFTPDSYEAVKSAIESMLSQGMNGLIMDLRFNPGGRLDQAIKIIDLFVDSGTILSTKGRNRAEQVVRATAEVSLPKFPVIVLINEHSASASEVLAGSLKDNKRAIVIGTRSYGKGSVQELVPLDQNGGELKMTVAYYYLPSGRLVHKKKDAADWGVEPNIQVKLDEDAQLRLQRERYEAELFRRPTSGPATTPATEAPLDAQLQRAVDTMTALLILGPDVPSTKPAD